MCGLMPASEMLNQIGRNARGSKRAMRGKVKGPHRVRANSNVSKKEKTDE